MSKILTVVRGTDIIESEMVKVNKFIEEGMPGLVDVTESQLHRMLDMYLTGSTYTQIATVLEIKKVVILYLAHSSGWYDTKVEYLNEVQENIKNRIIESKLRNKEFMVLAAQAYRKKIGHNMTQYLKTNDVAHMDNIDSKQLSQLVKTIEIIDGLDNTGKDSKGKTPAVGINIGEGVTVEKSGDDKITITPKEAKETPVGDILKQYADSKREEERRNMLSIASKSDIVNDKEKK